MIRVRILLLCLPLVLASPAYAMFKCVDEKGVTHFGDTMPPQCAQKSISEINAGGYVVRKIEAPPTPEQLKKREQEKAIAQAEHARIEEQKLKDRALLSTYASEKEFDAIRNRDLAQLEGRKKNLVSRAENLDKLAEKLAGDMEFYRAGKSKAGKTREVPALLQGDYDRAKKDRANIDEEIARIDADKAEVSQRYDVAKTRFKKLQSGMPIGTIEDDIPGLPPQLVGVSQLIAGRTRGYTRCQGRSYDCSMGITYQCPKPDNSGTVPVYCQEEKRPAGQ